MVRFIPESFISWLNSNKNEKSFSPIAHYLQLKYQVAKMRVHGSQWFYILKNKLKLKYFLKPKKYPDGRLEVAC